jgi:hypothetical protein
MNGKDSEGGTLAAFKPAQDQMMKRMHPTARWIEPPGLGIRFRRPVYLDRFAWFVIARARASD